MITTESMKRQLKELQKEKELLSQSFPGLEVPEIVDFARTVQAEFESLVADQIEIVLRERAELREAFPTLSIAEVIELAKAEQDRRAHEAKLAADPEARSLAAQLATLYAEIDQLNRAFPGLAPAQVVDTVKDKVRLVDQLKWEKSGEHSHLKAA